MDPDSLLKDGSRCSSPSQGPHAGRDGPGQLVQPQSESCKPREVAKAGGDGPGEPRVIISQVEVRKPGQVAKSGGDGPGEFIVVKPEVREGIQAPQAGRDGARQLISPGPGTWPSPCRRSTARTSCHKARSHPMTEVHCPVPTPSSAPAGCQRLAGTHTLDRCCQSVVVTCQQARGRRSAERGGLSTR